MGMRIQKRRMFEDERERKKDKHRRRMYINLLYVNYLHDSDICMNSKNRCEFGLSRNLGSLRNKSNSDTW